MVSIVVDHDISKETFEANKKTVKKSGAPTQEASSYNVEFEEARERRREASHDAAFSAKQCSFCRAQAGILR